MIVEFSNPPSKKIFVLIELLEKTELSNRKYHSVTSSNTNAENNNAIQELLYNAIETVAEISGLTTHDIERVLNDVIVNDDMRLNIVHFCRYITDWLITGNRTEIKKVLTDNIDENFTDEDRKAIEKWYSGNKK